MAGYFFYSFDSDKFNKFVTDPSDEQLLMLANIASEVLDEVDGDDYEEDELPNVLSDWPVEPEELVPVLRDYLKKEDLYAELPQFEKDAFEHIITDFYSEEDNGLDFQICFNENIYWDVVQIIRAFYKVPVDKVNETIISRVGMTPFRGMPDQTKILGFETWAPMHSIHLAEDVVKLRDEVLAAEEAVMNSNDDNAKQEYEDELMPALDKLVQENRVLFVSVDT